MSATTAWKAVDGRLHHVGGQHRIVAGMDNSEVNNLRVNYTLWSSSEDGWQSQVFDSLADAKAAKA